MQDTSFKDDPFHDPEPHPPHLAPKTVEIFTSVETFRYMFVYKTFLAQLFEEIISELSINYVNIINIVHSSLCNSMIYSKQLKSISHKCNLRIA